MFAEKENSQPEDGLAIPYDQLDPETLRRLIQEFVSRDGADWDDIDCTLEDKVTKVLQQLGSKQVQIVFDLKSQTANIVVFTPK